MQPKHTVPPLANRNDYSDEAWSLMVAAVTRSTGFARATVRKGLAGGRVQPAIRTYLQAALRDYHAARKANA